MFDDRRYALAAIVLVALKLWLVAAQPIVAMAGALHEDRLFLTLAESIASGDWLGDYSEFTLMRGPIYPLWIAVTFLLGAPLPLANQLLYLLACRLVVRALRDHLAHDIAALGLFALLWWNPMSFEAADLGRIAQTTLSTPTLLLLFAGLIAFETRRLARPGIRGAWGALAGASLAAWWLTGEETRWLWPSVALLLLVAGWSSWRAGERLRPLGVPVAAGLTAFTLLVGSVCAMNLRHYGWFGTTEVRAPRSVAAHRAFERLVEDHEFPLEPVTREARELAYQASPAFATLRPYLEGSIGLRWAEVSERWTQRPAEERQITSGEFVWAMREAVAAAGSDRNAAETLAFYQRVADEMRAAHEDGRHAARRPEGRTTAPTRPDDPTRVVPPLPAALDYFITFRGFTGWPPPSRGDAPSLQLFRDLSRWHLSHPIDAPEQVLPLQQRENLRRISALHYVGKSLRPISTTVVIGGWVLWLCVGLGCVVRRQPCFLLAVAVALIGAVILFNTLGDGPAFPALSPGTFAPAYPLALLSGGLGWAEAVRRCGTPRAAWRQLHRWFDGGRQRWSALSWWQQALVTCAAVALVLFLRKGHVLLHPQFWGEDGNIFFKQNLVLGVRAIFEPHAGYLHLAPRLVAWLGTPFAPCGSPAAYVYASLFGTLAVAARLFSPRLRLPAKPWLALCIVLVPHQGEVFLTPTNLQWVFGLLLAQVLLTTEPVTRAHGVRDGLAVALAGLSGPQIILAAPLFAWRCFRRRTRASGWIFAVTLACAAVQIGYLLANPRPPPTEEPIRILDGLATIAQRFPLQLIVGEWMGWAPTPTGGLVASAGWGLLLGLLVLVLVDPRLREEKCLLLAFALLLIAASAYRDRFDLYHSNEYYSGDRYFYIPRALLLWVLGLSAALVTWRERFAALVCVLALLMNAGQFRIAPYRDFGWPEFCRRIEAGENVLVPVNPSGSIFEIPARTSGP